MLMSVSLKLGTGAVEPATARALFRLPVQDADISPYEPVPDGQRFLVVAPEHAAPLTVIVNWPALLSKAPNAQ
jgi:hypothetical protein